MDSFLRFFSAQGSTKAFFESDFKISRTRHFQMDKRTMFIRIRKINHVQSLRSRRKNFSNRDSISLKPLSSFSGHKRIGIALRIKNLRNSGIANGYRAWPLLADMTTGFQSNIKLGPYGGVSL